MKRELMFLFPFGTTAWLFGSLFINRSSKKDAQSTMKTAGDEMKKRNVSARVDSKSVWVQYCPEWRLIGVV